MLLELMREPHSHLLANLRGLREVASLTDIATIQGAEMTVNANKDADKHPAHIELLKPWPEIKPNADVTPERRAELEATLAKYSVFAT